MKGILNIGPAIEPFCAMYLSADDQKVVQKILKIVNKH